MFARLARYAGQLPEDHAGKKPQADNGNHQAGHGQPGGKREVSCAAEAASLRGPGQKSDAEGLDETGRRQPAGEGQRSDGQDEDDFRSIRSNAVTPWNRAWKVSHSLKKPLSGGRAEMAIEPIRKKQRRLRHAPDQAAVLFDVACVRRGDHRTCPQEQQRLEGGVVQGVKERRRQPQRREGVDAQRRKDDGAAQAQQDDADVLDAVIGEQSLEIVLRQGVQHTQQRRDRSDDDDRAGPTTDNRPGMMSMEIRISM